MRRITFSIGLGNRATLGNLHEELWKTSIFPRLNNTFGGFTLTKGKGGWISPNGTHFVEEQMDISVIDMVGLSQEIRDVAGYLAKYFNQEAVMVTVEELKEVRFIGPN
jgi:hypothetical protein